MNSEIQDKINRYCIINRKYQLLDESSFKLKFRKFDIEKLNVAWEFGSKKIQNNEIIKDTKELPKNGRKEISKKLEKLNFNSNDLYIFLNSKFDEKELKLDEEQIERRLRNLIAQRHQKIILNEINKLISKQKLNQIKEKVVNIAFLSIIPILIITFFFGSRIRDGFTTVDVLTERIYEREIYNFSGSICNDGSTSHSQGRGTCSWHGGVAYKFYKGDHKYSKDECRKKAKEISWIE
jgi:hypothetical protein